MTATHTMCGRENCKVRPAYLQATRTESALFLGYSGFCPDCQVSFKVGAPRMAIGEPVGAVDDRGYLWCASCKDPGWFARDKQIMADSAPHNTERCDGCGCQLAA